jgi:hypothetical protein
MKLKVPLAVPHPLISHPLDVREESVPIAMAQSGNCNSPGEDPLIDPEKDRIAEEIAIKCGYKADPKRADLFASLTEYQRSVVLPPGAQAYFDSKKEGQ